MNRRTFFQLVACVPFAGIEGADDSLLRVSVAGRLRAVLPVRLTTFKHLDPDWTQKEEMLVMRTVCIETVDGMHRVVQSTDPSMPVGTEIRSMRFGDTEVLPNGISS